VSSVNRIGPNGTQESNNVQLCVFLRCQFANLCYPWGERGSQTGPSAALENANAANIVGFTGHRLIIREWLAEGRKGESAPIDLGIQGESLWEDFNSGDYEGALAF
jgi:hypothetical protein